ncbi:hypothetical protein SAMN06265222_101208 [Neorhodopirellula lusitana]|uniref:Uncharacterized protein n=1 Tax=Neorhodopirellula lusitana TaxID=445327 RepID=A0ABY1PN88_9BACT|nr:hypothetical protein SAMN06265222_101208 [Neorhodopirellula lusitana]
MDVSASGSESIDVHSPDFAKPHPHHQTARVSLAIRVYHPADKARRHHPRHAHWNGHHHTHRWRIRCHDPLEPTGKRTSHRSSYAVELGFGREDQAISCLSFVSMTEPRGMQIRLPGTRTVDRNRIPQILLSVVKRFVTSRPPHPPPSAQACKPIAAHPADTEYKDSQIPRSIGPLRLLEHCFP